MKKCIICGNSMLKLKRYKNLLRCKKCSYMCADCSMEDEELANLYDEEFWRGGAYTDYLADRMITTENFRSRLKKILVFVKQPEKKSVFEIGCAYGLFLSEAKKYFASVRGIDISKSAIQFAKKELKSNVIYGDYLTYKIDDCVDLVCMWDTIEHLKDPSKFLKKANSHIKMKGFLAISTCDMGSLNARFRGEHWRQYNPPIHLQYFTKESLTKLLNKYGFEVCKVMYPWNKMSLNNALYIILCIRNNNIKLYNFLVKLGIKKIKIYVNLHDYMFIMAKKTRNV